MKDHGWLMPMLATLLIAVLVNGALVAYSYGKLDQRVQALEERNTETREDWKAGRVRIERALEQLREAVESIRSMPPPALAPAPAPAPTRKRLRR